MDKLEKLYEIADQHLEKPEGGEKDWTQFAVEFEEHFDAKMVLYRPVVDNNTMDLKVTAELVAANDDVMIKQYFEDRIYELKDEEMVPDPPIPFEPARRTDSVTDDAVKKFSYFDSFLEPHGIFYVMGCYAMLSDQTLLALMVWRDETKVDFSDLEKLRLALFMRLLAQFVSKSISDAPSEPANGITEFGQKYDLTGSEVGVLAELLEGHSLKAIAEKSRRSYGTVRWHVHNILEKCGVASQRSLVSEFYKLIKH